MSQILLSLLVVTSLSMHACSARHLIITSPFHDQATTQILPQPYVQMVQVGASSDHVPVTNSAPENEAETQDADGNFLGAITSAIKHSLFRPSFIEVTAGNNEATVGQGLMRKIMWRGRALMKKEKESNVTEEDDDHQSKESTSAQEDSNSVDMMDYAQPHRKPPIHNEKH
ncbi:hypothetical protein LINPERPRIM_LOCUS9999 [Linum perenne]